MKALSQKFSSLTTMIALIVLMIIITCINPNFMTANNLLNLLLQVTANGFIAFGMTFVILTSGIDLSVGAILALSSAVSAGFIAQGMPLPLAVVCALIIGAFLGAINGALIAYGKLAPFIVTLATQMVYRGATLVFTDGNPITKHMDGYFLAYIGQGYLLGIPFPVILMILVFIVLWILLHKTAFGKSVYALGGNEKAAYISGIKLNKVKNCHLHFIWSNVRNFWFNHQFSFVISNATSRFWLRNVCNRCRCPWGNLSNGRKRAYVWNYDWGINHWCSK